MTFAPDSSERPMAEPTPAKRGADVGGMRASADGGLADATQRSMEGRDEVPPPSSSADEPEAAESGGKATAAPARDNNAAWDADDAALEQSDEPVSPRNESPLESLGKSISEVVTGEGTSPTKAPSGRS